MEVLIKLLKGVLKGVLIEVFVLKIGKFEYLDNNILHNVF